jgi:hypothetical protein
MTGIVGMRPVSREHVEIQRLAGSSALLRAIEHGNLLHGRRQRRAEPLRVPGTVQRHLQHADLLAVGVQPRGRVLEHFKGRPNHHDDALGQRMAGVAEQPVLAPGQRAHAIHRALHDLGHAGVERVRRLPRLEERVGVVRRAADDRALRRQGARAVRADEVVVNRCPDLLVGNHGDLVFFVRRPEPVEEEEHWYSRLERGHLRHERKVVRLLHRRRGEHRKPDHARAHHVRVVAEDRQRLRRQRPRRHVKDARRELAGNLVHVGQHQQEPLRGRERRRQRPALQRAVHGAGRAALRLHLLNHRNLAPDVLEALRRPGVGELRHRGRRRDREDGADVVDAIRDVGGSRVAVHDDRLDWHPTAPSERRLTTAQ